MPKDAKEKLQKIKKKLDKFQKEVITKFDKYIMGITLLPPQLKQGMPDMPPPGLGMPFPKGPSPIPPTR